MGVKGVVRRQGKHVETLTVSARFEEAAFRADDELLVAARAQSVRQQQQLLLAAAKVERRVEVNDLHRWRGSPSVPCTRFPNPESLFPCFSRTRFEYLLRTYLAAIKAIQNP